MTLDGLKQYWILGGAWIVMMVASLVVAGFSYYGMTVNRQRSVFAKQEARQWQERQRASYAERQYVRQAYQHWKTLPQVFSAELDETRVQTLIERTQSIFPLVTINAQLQMPATIVAHPYFKTKHLRVHMQEVTLHVSAPTDILIFEGLEHLLRTWPGYLQLRRLSLRRVEGGEPLVEGNIVLIWWKINPVL